MANVNNSARRARLLSHLSCEYQIALYLFIYDGMSNSALRRLVDASGTTFSVALRNLRSRGAIYFKVDPDDRRRKLYYVSDKIRVIMEKAHQEVFIWLDLVARRDTKSRRLSSEQPPL
jgi:DNA-binding MarR family transcriptional regulator